MTTPVVALMQQVATLWQAATPPDRPDVPYRNVPSLDVKDGFDRTFTWEFPVREGTRSEGGDGQTTQVEWELSARIFLTYEGRGDLAFSVANEVNLLSRVIERETTWPQGVLTVITDRVDNIEQLPSEDVLITFVFRVLSEETD